MYVVYEGQKDSRDRMITEQKAKEEIGNSQEQPKPPKNFERKNERKDHKAPVGFPEGSPNELERERECDSQFEEGPVGLQPNDPELSTREIRQKTQIDRDSQNYIALKSLEKQTEEREIQPDSLSSAHPVNTRKTQTQDTHRRTEILEKKETRRTNNESGTKSKHKCTHFQD